MIVMMLIYKSSACRVWRIHLPLKIGEEIQKDNAEKLTPPEIRAVFYYAYADEFDPELPSLVYKTLIQDVDAAWRPRERSKNHERMVELLVRRVGGHRRC